MGCATLALKDGRKGSALTADRGVPIFEDQVIVSREPVVETLDVIGHATFYSADRVSRIYRDWRVERCHSCGDIRPSARSDRRRGRRQMPRGASVWTCWSPPAASYFPGSMSQRLCGPRRTNRAKA